MYHNKLWEILKEMGIPDHPTCLLRYLYAGQEATIRTGHGTKDWFQIGKERKKESEVAQSCPTLCDPIKLWKILKEMGIPDHLPYLLRILYTGQQLEPDN